jgi:hypothetical protein
VRYVAFSLLQPLVMALCRAQGHAADRFRDTGNHAWLLLWAATRAPAIGGYSTLCWLAGVDSERSGL